MVITTLETIHRLLKIEKNEAEAALNETHIDFEGYQF